MYFNNARQISHGFHQGSNFFRNANHMTKHIIHNPIMRILPHDVQSGLHKTAEHIESIHNGLERVGHVVKPIEEHLFKFH